MADIPPYRPLRVVIAGGGTGGHLFPGIAIAQAFLLKNPDTRIVFVTSGKKIEETVLADSPFDQRRISVEGVKGRGWIAKIAAVFKLPGALIASMRLLWAYRADLVIGMGGYSAGPVALGAWILRIPRFICEQNSIPGLTNRLLAPLAARVYVSFPNNGFNNQAKVMFSGNPVRDDIRRTAAEEKSAGRRFTVLVAGGSQGAHRVNLAVMEAASMLKNPDRFTLIHQTGDADVEIVKKTYAALGIDHEAAPFFRDMATRYQRADFAICRAGATTVAELTVSGLPALFIPFPFAADNHQVSNARALVENGAAEMVEEQALTPQWLAGRLDHLADHPNELTAMREKMRSLSKPDAAEEIVEDIYRVGGFGSE